MYFQDFQEVLDWGVDADPSAARWPPIPELVALAARDGLVVAAHGAPNIGLWVEVDTGDGWETVGRMTGNDVWVGEPVESGTLVRARQIASQRTSTPAAARAMALSWDDDAAQPLFEGEAIATAIGLSTAMEPGLGAASLRLGVETEDGLLYLPADCHEDDCWSSEAESVAEARDLAELGTELDLEFALPPGAAAARTVSAELLLHPDSGPLVVATATRELIALGGVWRWGDLHAHSRWSNDGCEDPDDECGYRGDAPASDFYENAADASLDFAALTDHAEWDEYYPTGLEGDALPVWEGQAGAVADAIDGAVLPVLGYEWSHGSDSYEDDLRRGSHRTVLLSDPSACESYRVGGLYSEEDWLPDHGDWVFTTENERIAETVAALWEDLDAADGSCGTDLRWITFAHHPAYEIPQPTVWALDENRPTRETLVEIYSEHGSSECLDPDADGCDFGYNERQEYNVDGAVQTALDAGFQLGFVAGTDGHDARPGSLDDGPSTVAHWRDEDDDGEWDAVATQFTDGGLTGALVEGELDVSALFDALDGRRTAATSGPRPSPRVFARDPAGVVYPPGAPLSAADGPFELTLILDARLDEHTGALLEQIERVGVGGEVVDTTAESTYEGGWAPEAGEWTYLRLRYVLEDGSAARVWLSPWFAE